MAEFRQYIFGEWKNGDTPLTAQEAGRICDKAEELRHEVLNYPPDKVLALLGRLKDKWRDPDYKPRLEILEALPSATGFSTEMIALALNYLEVVFDPDLLQKKLDHELRGISRSYASKYDHSTRTSLQWRPIGTVLHVLAGNVFLGAASSLVEGLITGNINIIKMSSAEKIFLPKLIESLIECDEDGVISGSIAVVDYSSSQKDVMGEFKKRVDGIVVWGGEEAVKGYRNDLPARTRLIVFGPKLSLAVITAGGAAACPMAEIAKKLADEISIWDQNACTAPQMCFVEGAQNAKRLVEALANSLEKIEKTLPSGEIDLQRACEIRKFRTIFEIAEARDPGSFCLKESSSGLKFTVILDNDMSIEPSPLHRTIRVVPYENFDALLPRLEQLRGYIQTVGVVISPAEQYEVSEKLSAAGALRIVEISKMAGGEIEDPHDAGYDLPQYLNLIMTRVPQAKAGGAPEEFDPVDFMPVHARAGLINERLRRLIAKARRSEFYSKRLSGLKIDSTEDLEKIPVLTRQEMDANIPPAGNGLSTGPWYGGYVSRSGGSTGKPKFSIYDGHDWEEMINNAGRLFRSVGIKKGDRLANCLLAGDLYGSFVSFDHINVRAGVTSFAFAGSLDPEVFLEVWRKFNINALQGVPSLFTPALREIKELEPCFTLEKIIYAGQTLSSADHNWLTSTLGVKRISSVIGANDGGQIAFQCAAQSGALHHVIDDFNFIEVVDENGKRVEDGVQGKLIITSLLKYAFPLIRYEIGDRGRIVPGLCGCGRTIRTLEYLGRTDDIVCVGAMNFKYGDIRGLLSGLPVTELQIAARTCEKGDYIVLRVESGLQTEDFRKKIRTLLLEKTEKLGERLKTGALYKLEIELFKPGLLPRNERTGKLKSLIDER